MTSNDDAAQISDAAHDLLMALAGLHPPTGLNVNPAVFAGALVDGLITHAPPMDMYRITQKGWAALEGEI